MPQNLYTMPGSPRSQGKTHQRNMYLVPGKDVEPDIKYRIHIGEQISDQFHPNDSGKPVILKIPCNPSSRRSLRGGLGIFGMPGCGKSSIAVHLVASIINSREFLRSEDHILIIDCNGEWLRKFSNRNWTSRYDKFRIDPSDVNSIIRPNYYISDFDDPFDWECFGFSPLASASSYMLLIATEGVMYHKNNPDLMLEMLSMLPSDRRTLQEWNETYPQLAFPKALATPTAVSMAQHFYEVSRFFKVPPSDTPHPSNDEPRITQWDRELEKKKVTIINIPLRNSTGENWTSKYAGAVLGKTFSLMRKQREMDLMIVIEEADILINNQEKGGPLIGSSIALASMVLKDRKKGFFLITICQIPSNLNPDVLKNTPIYLFADLPKNEMRSLLKVGTDEYLPNLTANQLARERKFYLVHGLTNTKIKLTPVDSAVKVDD